MIGFRFQEISFRIPEEEEEEEDSSSRLFGRFQLQLRFYCITTTNDEVFFFFFFITGISDKVHEFSVRVCILRPTKKWKKRKKLLSSQPIDKSNKLPDGP